MNVATYLARIGLDDPGSPDVEGLTRLHVAHLRTVPFENLDIRLGRRIELSLDRFHEKIVTRRRGGFCYELNGLFAWLLEALGFRATLLSACVYGDDGMPGPEYDHLALLVETRDGTRLLADVGFGDSFVEPLRLVDREQRQRSGSFRLRTDAGRTILERSRQSDGWAPLYAFTFDARSLDEFAPMCEHQQTSPDSTFTQKIVCSRATDTGRVTFTGDRLVETTPAGRTEREIPDAASACSLLARHLDVTLDAADVETLFTLATASRTTGGHTAASEA